MAAQLPTDQLIVRAVRARAACKRARVEALLAAGRKPPLGWRQFGATTALAHPGFGRVLAFCSADAHHLDETLAWYAERSVDNIQIEVPPLVANSELHGMLARHGFYFERAQSLLVRERPPSTALDGPAIAGLSEPRAGDLEIENAAAASTVSAVSVEPVSLEGLPEFARVFADAFRLYDNAAERPETISDTAAEHADLPRWRLFIARVDGEATALGSLYLHDEGADSAQPEAVGDDAPRGPVGFLANSATLEPMRRRGCHAALIRARLTAAAELGLDTLFVDTRVNSDAERNLHRAGFRLICHSGIWRRLPTE